MRNSKIEWLTAKSLIKKLQAVEQPIVIIDTIFNKFASTELEFPPELGIEVDEGAAAVIVSLTIKFGRAKVDVTGKLSS